MTLKRIAAGAVVALAGLALTAVIAANPFSTQASSQQQDETTRPQATEHLQAADDEDTRTEPYIGIAIVPVPPAEAEELGIEGGARVVRVEEEGPSGGLLEVGDIITNIGSQSVSSPRDVVDIVLASEAGDVLAVTVRRGEDTSVLNVTVGEREIRTRAFTRRFARAMPEKSDPGRMLMGQALRLGDRFARGQMVVADADGNYRTYRAAIGTVVTSDPGAGTLTLQPRDGSDPISYTVTDETRVNMSRDGDIGPLNTVDTTLVVDVDGVAKIIRQGDLPRPDARHGRGMGKRGHAGIGSMFGRSGHGPGGRFPMLGGRGAPGAMHFGQGGPGSGFGQMLPPEMLDMLESLGVDSFEPDSITDLACSDDMREHLPAGIEVHCETLETTTAPTITGDTL